MNLGTCRRDLAHNQLLFISHIPSQWSRNVRHCGYRALFFVHVTSVKAQKRKRGSIADYVLRVSVCYDNNLILIAFHIILILHVISAMLESNCMTEEYQ
jgi:hypothetical protein